MWFLFLLTTHLLIECNSIITVSCYLMSILIFTSQRPWQWKSEQNIFCKENFLLCFLSFSVSIIFLLGLCSVYFSLIFVCLSRLTFQDWWFSEVLQRPNSSHPLDHWTQTHLGRAESPALWQETDQRRRHCLSYSYISNRFFCTEKLR